MAWKFGGAAVTVAYGIAVPAMFATLAWGNRDPVLGGMARRHERTILAVAAIAAIAAFAILNPVAESGLLGPGSDRDDALEIGIGRLLDGRFPYYGRTQFGTPLSPMPGALLLGMPFHLLGDVAWQNTLWIVAGLLLAAHAGRHGRTGALAAAAVLLGNAEVMHEHVVGGDLVSNTVYVAAALWLVHRVGSSATPPSAARLAVAGALLALAVVSRPVFAPAAILGCAFVFGRLGPRAALAIATGGAAAGALLVLPFLIYDAAAFFPGHTLRKVPASHLRLSYAMIVLSALVAAVPAVRPLERLHHLYALMAVSIALILAVPVAVRGMADPIELTFLLPFGLFGALAVLPELARGATPLPAA